MLISQEKDFPKSHWHKTRLFLLLGIDNRTMPPILLLTPQLSTYIGDCIQQQARAALRPTSPKENQNNPQLCYCSVDLNLPCLTCVHSKPFFKTSHLKSYSTQTFKTVEADNNAQGVQSIYKYTERVRSRLHQRKEQYQGEKHKKRLGVENWNHEKQAVLLNPKLLSVEEKKQIELYRSKNVIQSFMRRTVFLTELGK